jgi:large subunit ribosomal protein L9
MEIILVKDVDNLGLAGQTLKVANGYARNYLLPHGVALEASPGNLKVLAKKRAEFENRAKEVKEKAVEMKNSLSSLHLVLVRKAGDKGKLYGAVTTQDLVDAAQPKGFAIDRKRLRLLEPIKTVGDFEAVLRIHPEVQAPIKIKVVAEGSAQDPAVIEAAAAKAEADKAAAAKAEADKAAAAKAEAGKAAAKAEAGKAAAKAQAAKAEADKPGAETPEAEKA